MRAFPLLLVAALLVPGATRAQDRQRVPPKDDTGTTAPAQAVPRESAPPRESSPPRESAPPQTSSPPASAVPRSAEPRATAPPSSAPAPDRDQAQRRQRVPPEARRDGGGSPRTGTAVPRSPDNPPRRDGDRRGDRGDGDRRAGGVYVQPRYNNYYYYPRRYYPYGYGAYGLGYFYYDPYAWDPYYYGPYYDTRGPFRGYGYGYATGELRLDVRPRDAEVYVDGYYAGRVDDFDGVFQSLTLEEGAYRIEIVAPGYETLDFDVRVLPGRKTTYHGDLLRGRRP